MQQESSGTATEKVGEGPSLDSSSSCRCFFSSNIKKQFLVPDFKTFTSNPANLPGHLVQAFMLHYDESDGENELG